MKKAVVTILTAALLLGGATKVAFAQSQLPSMEYYTYEVPEKNQVEDRAPVEKQEDKKSSVNSEEEKRAPGKCEKHEGQGQCEKEHGKCRARDRMTIEKVLMEDFKISRENLDKALNEGKCYGDILKENNINYDNFKEKYLQTKFKEIDEKVSRGTMTKEKAEDFKNKIKEHISNGGNNPN